MKPALAMLVLLLCIASLVGFTRWTYVKQGEKAFFYNVSSGRPVNQHDNPLLTGRGATPQFDETLRWNSSEGVVMDAEYKLYGQVTDPWAFYLHFGELEHEYKAAPRKDIKLYEALRFSGKAINQHLNEVAAAMDAETIRTRPDLLKTELLAWVRPYMKQFGFEVTDLLFMGNFKYPDGNVIDQARRQLTDLDAEIRSKEQERENKANQAKVDVSQIGVDGTMKLKMTELYGELSKSGVIPTVIVTEDSIFAAPFYPAAPVKARAPSANGEKTSTAP